MCQSVIDIVVAEDSDDDEVKVKLSETGHGGRGFNSR